MPGTGLMQIAVAAFPAAVSAGDLPAADRAGLPARRCGERVVCHLRAPLHCRLAVRGWRAHVVAAGPAADAVAGPAYALRQRARAWPLAPQVRALPGAGDAHRAADDVA